MLLIIIYLSLLEQGDAIQIIDNVIASFYFMVELVPWQGGLSQNIHWHLAGNFGDDDVVHKS